MLKLDATGGSTWVRQLGLGNQDAALDLALQTDGGITVAGYLSRDDPQFEGRWLIEGFVARLNGQGDIAWLEVQGEGEPRIARGAGGLLVSNEVREQPERTEQFYPPTDASLSLLLEE